MTLLEAKKAPNIRNEETHICLDYMPRISPEDQPLPQECKVRMPTIRIVDAVKVELK